MLEEGGRGNFHSNFDRRENDNAIKTNSIHKAYLLGQSVTKTHICKNTLPIHCGCTSKGRSRNMEQPPGEEHAVSDSHNLSRRQAAMQALQCTDLYRQYFPNKSSIENVSPSSAPLISARLPSTFLTHCFPLSTFCLLFVSPFTV